MRINYIKLKSRRNENIFCVSIDENVIDLHSDIIVKYKLKTGDDISQDILNKIKQESDYLICLNLATTYLSNKLKTTKQLKDYLYKKGFHSDVINDVEKKLLEYNILNDKYYAEVFIKSNENKFNKGSMQAKLLSKGIKKECFEDELQEICDTDLCLVMAKKFMKNKEYNKENFEKLIRHLQYKRFNWSDINSSLKQLKIDYEFEN